MGKFFCLFLLESFSNMKLILFPKRAGALPRLTRVVGRQRAMEMCLAGRAYSAQQMHEWGVVNAVVDGDVVAEAVKWAVEIAGNSPDAVIVSRQGVMSGWDGISAQVRSCLLWAHCLV